MAGTRIPFFERATFVGGGNTTYYFSDPFDMTQFDSVTTELRVHSMIGTSPQIDLTIETAMDLREDDVQLDDGGGWFPHIDDFATVSSAPHREYKTLNNWGRFARAKLKITAPSSDVIATLQVIGMGRTSS